METRIVSKDVARTFADMRPVGGYPVALIDFPWKFENWSERGEEKNATAHYDCMSIEEIKAFPASRLFAKDCVVFMWVTWPLMPHWAAVIEAQGLKYSGLAWEWRKFNPETGKYAYGPGYGSRKNLEPCLLCTRGNPSLKAELPDDLFGMGRVPEGVRSVRDWMEWWPDTEIRARARGHSRKPDEQYDRIETMFDGPYIELFARQRRKGWAAWGNQVDKFGEAA
jgi:N6-adenosine-specific RNA methylase IME4